MKKPRFFIIILIMTAAVMLAAGGCLANKNSGSQEITRTGFYFDTVVTITIYNGDSKNGYNEILDECMEKCGAFEKMISKTEEDSETSKINRAKGSAVTVSDTMALLIKKSLYYGRLTKGAFDITVNPVSLLWNFDKKNAEVPDDAAIRKAKKHIDYRRVSLNGNAVSLNDPEASVDFGGIAKGMIADSLSSFLKEKGVTSAVINLGGNIVTIGERPSGGDFRIGIKKPFSENEFTAIVRLSDKSVVTSGVYERYFEKDGRRYHHIIDPETGYPCDNGLLSVTIISDTSADGDALSTGCFVLGPDKGMTLVESLPGTEAVFILEDGSYLLSDGLRADSKDVIRFAK